ncbi:MAG: hypothetical protein CSB47_06595 [Proteobacteria bacterium]|nr:MAG: hypothetical protein CSB47_06595 [Pseudomonadota bacterium]
MMHPKSMLLSGVTVLALLSPLVSAERAVDTTEETSPLHQSLTLDNQGENCVLNIIGDNGARQSITLLLETPCYWVSSGESSTMQQYSYPEFDAQTTLLVAGTTLDWTDEQKKYQKLPTNTACSQYLQGIVINEGGVAAVNEIMEAPHCKTLVVDEKVFKQAASVEKRYQQLPVGHFKESSKTGSVITKEGVASTPISVSDNTHDEQEKSLLDTVQQAIKRLFSEDD